MKRRCVLIFHVLRERAWLSLRQISSTDMISAYIWLVIKDINIRIYIKFK